MHKLHVTAVAALLAVAVVLGSVAAVRTTGLGAASRHANDAAVAAKKKQLASYERRLRHALAAKTPALPKVPRVPAAPVRPAAPPAPAPSQRVVYHRPPPIVVVKHTHHGDDGGVEAEGGGGDD